MVKLQMMSAFFQRTLASPRQLHWWFNLPCYALAAVGLIMSWMFSGQSTARGQTRSEGQMGIDAPRPPGQRAAAAKRCSLDGNVAVDVGSYRFSIPRTIFEGVLPLKPHGSVDPRCSELPLRGDGVLLGVSATRSGTDFYRDWISEKRLPHRITIRLRGVIKWYPADDFLTGGNNKIENHPLGFSVTSYGPYTLYDALSLKIIDHSNRGVVFQCRNTETVKARTCRTSYPLNNDFDLGYEFFVRELGPESWVNLDQRVREFIAALMVARN